MRLPVHRVFYCRNPEPAKPVPEGEASWLASPMMITPGRLTQMGTQSLTIRPAAASRQVELEAEAEE